MTVEAQGKQNTLSAGRDRSHAAQRGGANANAMRSVTSRRSKHTSRSSQVGGCISLCYRHEAWHTGRPAEKKTS